ncbi:hypothetical protein CEXT_684611, partial [Caerostris extrusa]
GCVCNSKCLAQNSKLAQLDLRSVLCWPVTTALPEKLRCFALGFVKKSGDKLRVSSSIT